MIESRIAARYGHALFELACRDGSEQAVADELASLKSVLDKDRRFLDLLAAPQIPDEDKVELAKTVLKATSQHVIVNFMLFLIEKRRAGHLLDIIDDYGRRLDERKGIVEAKITSAITLTDDELKKIISCLERRSGKQVRYRLDVDPEILGGVIVIMGGEIIDHSVRHDLIRLRDTLRAVKVHEAA
jgi:F-type H+-transporting ATPase subunit delta